MPLESKAGKKWKIRLNFRTSVLFKTDIHADVPPDRLTYVEISENTHRHTDKKTHRHTQTHRHTHTHTNIGIFTAREGRFQA